jgi:protein phosphatase
MARSNAVKTIIGLGKTDTGAVREKNEDAVLIVNEELGVLKNVFAVADGMGGHKGGDIASATAVTEIEKYLRRVGTEHGKFSQDLLRDAVEFANGMIFNMAAGSRKYKGMGTTICVCSRDDSNLYYAHVGDSRIYVLRNSVLRQITKDHTWVNEMIWHGSLTEQEAAVHPRRHMLTRALGTERNVEIDFGYLPMKKTETVLICSDGLTGMVEDKVILQIINKHNVKEDKEKIIDELIEEANKNGGNDNISVVII